MGASVCFLSQSTLSFFSPAINIVASKPLLASHVQNVPFVARARQRFVLAGRIRKEMK